MCVNLNRFVSLLSRFLYYALDFMNGGDLFRHWRKHRNRRTEMAPFYASEVGWIVQSGHVRATLLPWRSKLIDAMPFRASRVKIRAVGA